MTNHGRSACTKPWNTKMDSVEPDEMLYTDYKDGNHTQITSLKFKTTKVRLPVWIEVHMEYYGEDAVCDSKTNLTTIRLKEDKDGTLIIKFHHTTGVVLIQGSKLHMWKTSAFTLIKSRVDIKRIRDTDEDNLNDSSTCAKSIVKSANTARMYARMYARTYACMHTCIHERTHVCTDVHTHIR